MTTTITADQLTPGHIARTDGVDTHGLDLTKFRQIAAVDTFLYGDRLIEFTDGTTARVGRNREFQVADATTLPGTLNIAAALIAAYATADSITNRLANLHNAKRHAINEGADIGDIDNEIDLWEARATSGLDAAWWDQHDAETAGQWAIPDEHTN